MDDPDPHLQRVLGAPGIELMAEVVDLSGVFLIDADEDLHERRFAGSVLPYERVDLGLLKVEIHLPKGMDAGEALVDALHRQDLSAHHLPPHFHSW